MDIVHVSVIFGHFLKKLAVTSRYQPLLAVTNSQKVSETCVLHAQIAYKHFIRTCVRLVWHRKHSKSTFYTFQSFLGVFAKNQPLLAITSRYQPLLAGRKYQKLAFYTHRQHTNILYERVFAQFGIGNAQNRTFTHFRLGTVILKNQPLLAVTSRYQPLLAARKYQKLAFYTHRQHINILYEHTLAQFGTGNAQNRHFKFQSFLP